MYTDAGKSHYKLTLTPWSHQIGAQKQDQQLSQLVRRLARGPCPGDLLYL